MTKEHNLLREREKKIDMQTVFVELFLNAGLSEAAVVAFPRVDDTGGYLP